MRKSAQGHGGGAALLATQVHTLKGPAFDHIAIMRYPNREAFIGFAMGTGKADGEGRPKDEIVAEGFRLREAGLAGQGLVCMRPDHVYVPPAPTASASML